MISRPPGCKVLYGGIDAYRRPAPAGAGYGDTRFQTPILPGDGALARWQSSKASRDEIASALDLGLCNYVFLDTRTEAEYGGTRPFYNARAEGHIPNALWYPWKQVFVSAEDGNIRDKAEIRAELEAMGITDDSIIVAYCTGGIRSVRALSTSLLCPDLCLVRVSY